jgi:hypothetical protein
MANFSTDLDEAESRDAASKSFNRIDEWRIKDGETHYLRHVMNGAIPMDVHQYIPTKEKPAECNWPKWPEQMWGVCPRDKAFRVAGAPGQLIDEYEEGYGECYIHNHYVGVKGKYDKDLGVPVVVSYGLAVVRKVVLDPVTSKPVGLADETFEFRAPSGDIVRLPKIVIVAQKYRQYWGAIKATQFLPPFSMCDKDFKITRQENDLKVTALDRTPDHQPGTPSWKRYEEAMALLDISVEKYLTEHASRNHYAKFFIPGELPEGGYGGGSEDEDGDKKAKGGAPTTATHPEVPSEDMDAFRQSLTNRAPGAAAAAAAADGMVSPVTPTTV